jgi:putative transcriptional regulator
MQYGNRAIYAVHLYSRNIQLLHMVKKQLKKKRLNAIPEALKIADKSLLWLSKESGLDYSLLHSYKSGKREPGLENLFKIANALKVNPKELINS